MTAASLEKSTTAVPDRKTFWGRLNRIGYLVLATVFVVGLVRVLELRGAGATLTHPELIAWAFVGGAIAVSAQILTITTMYRLSERQ